MIYKLNDKFYVKVSGYLIEVIPLLKNNDLTFDITQNKIEITPDLDYRFVAVDDIKNKLKNNTFNVLKKSENFGSSLKNLNERTHNKYKD